MDCSPYQDLYAKAAQERDVIAEKLRICSGYKAESDRAVHIAAVIMQAAGLCRFDDPGKCRTYEPTDAHCVRCIERWLYSKARAELRREEKKCQTSS